MANQSISPKRSNHKAVAQKKTKSRNSTVKKALQKPSGNRFLLNSLECFGLTVTAISAIMVLLGYSADWFSGTHFLTSLLPFAFGVLALVVATALLLIAWWKLRRILQNKSIRLPALLAVGFALIMGWFGIQNHFSKAFDHFRMLVGGKQEAGRVTIAHQVYAAYRRFDRALLVQMVSRAESYSAIIVEAANAYDIDVNLLQGIAATESSFLPRDSRDGGRGLFQITSVPKSVLSDVGKRLAVGKPDFLNPRHNAYVAAATLQYYLEEMRDDLFLALLAYNIGPKNGGLRFIMQQYGATDFVTIQPYLQQLPRDYPIRVLSYALAFKLWQKQRKFPVYEDGANAVDIQRVGIPGLQLKF